MRSLLVILCLASSFCFATDVTDLEARFCPDSVEQNGSRLRTFPLFHDKAPEGDYFIQNKWVDGARAAMLFTPNFSAKLPAGARALMDFKIIKESIWLLTRDTLAEFDKEGQLLNLYPIPESNQIRARGLGYHASLDAIFIAQGRIGLRKFDLNKREFTVKYPLNTINENGHRSSAISVVSHQGDLYTLMTGASQKGFNGVVIFDPVSVNIKNKAEYDRRRSGVVGVDARIYVYRDNVVINNSGWIHSISLDDAQNRSRVRPTWSAIAHVQENYQQYIMLSGDLIFNQDEAMGCGRVRNLRDQYYGKAFAKQI